MFSITTDIKSYTRKMNKINREYLPKAICSTVNVAAKGTFARGKKNIEKDFTVRNKYTLGSLKLYPSKYKPGRSIDRINAITGSKSPYLPLHEKGGTVRAKRRRLSIPTIHARRGVKSKVIARRFRMDRLGRIGMEGSKFFVIGTGIFFRRSKKKVVKVRDISKRSYRIKPTKWHTRAAAYFSRPDVFGRIFVSQAKKQMRTIKA